MSENIYTASAEYASRPDDERFPTFQSLIDAADLDRQISHEAKYATRDLRVVPDERTVRLESPKGQAEFTHYSFGQLCRTVKAPAAYLRTLPPTVAADALNFGLQEQTTHGQQVNILVRDPEGARYPIVRAATSETYGRVWDSNLYGEVNRWFGDGRSSNGGSWQSPPVWPGMKPGGQYRGDRDSFVIRVDGGSIVDDPRGWNARGQSDQGGRLHRGIMLRNSEVGECSITIDCVLFDVICGNHILWGAVIDRTYRRRHTGQKVTRDTMNELITLARKFNQRTASEDTRIIRALVDHEIAISKEAVISELQKMGATKEEATASYAHAEAAEPRPRSFWGIAAGMTRYSQESGHQDERFKLDQLAAAILKKGAIQYATV